MTLRAISTVPPPIDDDCRMRNPLPTCELDAAVRDGRYRRLEMDRAGWWVGRELRGNGAHAARRYRGVALDEHREDQLESPARDLESRIELYATEQRAPEPIDHALGEPPRA